LFFFVERLLAKETNEGEALRGTTGVFALRNNDHYE